MPKVNNSKPVPTEQSADYQLTVKLLAAFNETWKEQARQAEVDPVLYSRLSMVALNQLAATLAVDIGMPPEKFTAFCQAQYAQAYQRAPKFGE